MTRVFLWATAFVLATSCVSVVSGWVAPAHLATASNKLAPLRPSAHSRFSLRTQQSLKQSPAMRSRLLTGLKMAGDVSVLVESVTASPMGSAECVQELCNMALGFVTCKVSGGDQLVLQSGPLASSYYAVGAADGKQVIVPCSASAIKGQTISVQTSLAVTVPNGWTAEQAGLFPVLAIIFLQNLQLAGLKDLSSLKGKTVVVTGGLGPAASLALQLLVAVGARVVATGSGRDGEKLKKMGAVQVIDYKKDSFFDEVADISMVVDGVGMDDGVGLKKQGIYYVSVMHPAVALVVREGLWSGGRALQKYMTSEDTSCEFQASEEAMLLVQSAADILASAGVTPHYGKDAYTANEWLEAMGWPKDTDTGGRFGFPGRNLWEAPAFTSIASADVDGFVPVGLPSEEEVYAMDKASEEEALKEVFDKYDVDGSGGIDKEELRAAAKDFNLASTDDELESLIKKVDTDGDGKISFDEFVNAKIGKVQEVDSMGCLLECVSGGGRGPAPVTLVEFHAPFCRACRNMRGRFAKLPVRRPDARFLSVDVKKQRAVADELGVKDVPSYVLFKNGQRCGQWKGAFRVDELVGFLDAPAASE